MTLENINNLLLGSPPLRQRFLAARVQASWDILNEAVNTSNHINRLAWANAVLNNYELSAQAEYSRFMSNATIQINGLASTDNDIQFVVNSMIDTFANNLAAV